MSTSEILHANIERKAGAADRAATLYPDARKTYPASIIDEQICRLVRQLFFSSASRPPKQIVFSAVEEGTDVGGICMQTAEALSLMVPASVATVDASSFSRHAKNIELEEDRLGLPGKATAFRETSNQLSLNLWSVPGPAFWASDAFAGSPGWVHRRLGELRLDFDYTILHAPPAGVYSGGVLLGHASDGMVLVLEANITRRAAALKTIEILRNGNVKLLGTVLSGRTFPIPESIYQRI